jgi:acyl carrier protein
MSEAAFVGKLALLAKTEPGAVMDATPIDPEQWDSVDLLDLIAIIDETFGVTVANKELNRCTAVGDLRVLIARAKGALQ